MGNSHSQKDDDSDNVTPLSPYGLLSSGATFRTPEELYFELARRSNWKQFQVRMLHSKFKKLADKDGTIKKETFKQIFLDDKNISQQLVDSCFQQFDKDKTNAIDFCDFVATLSLICEGNSGDKIQFLFEMFDLDKDGVLCEEELKSFFQHAGSIFSRMSGQGWNSDQNETWWIEQKEEMLKYQQNMTETSPQALEQSTPDLTKPRQSVAKNTTDNKSSNINRLLARSVSLGPLTPRAKSQNKQEVQKKDGVCFQAFKSWATGKPITTLLRRFDVLPTWKEELQSIKSLMKTGLTEGDTWYILSAKWWSLWKSHVGFDNPNDTRTARPIAIDNTELLGLYECSLKEELEENCDFILVPKTVWDELIELYGGGVEIPRKVISLGNVLRIELYPYCLTFVQADPKGIPLPNKKSSKLMSMKSTIKELSTIVASTMDTSLTSSRFWRVDASTGDWIQLEGNDQDTLEDLSFHSGDVVMVETPNTNGDWPMDHRSSSKDWKSFKVGDVIDASDCNDTWQRATIVKNNEKTEQIFIHYEGWSSRFDEWLSTSKICTCRSVCTKMNGVHRIAKAGSQTGSEQTRVLRSPTLYFKDTQGQAEPGITGLHNLGNTCFMNSCLQCISHTPILTSYFLDDRYKADINKTNPLALKGVLVNAYALLLKNLWNEKYKAIAPNEIKKVIGQFAPRFRGYAQQDSQEFLAFLLDGLHEELNRVKKKPLTTKLECDGTISEDQIAQDSWKIHQLRNQSIIVDLLQGQLRSKLTCPSCDKVSITFDPFMFLSLPVPSATTRPMTVLLVSNDGHVLPTEFLIRLSRNASIKELKENINKMCKMDIANMTIADVYRAKIYSVYRDIQSISTVRDDDLTVVYEQDPEINESKNECNRYLQVLHLQKKSSESYTGYFTGLPLLLSLPPVTTNRQIYDMIEKRCRMWYLPPNENKNSNETPHSPKGTPNSPRSFVAPFKIFLKDRSGLNCGRCSDGCNGCELKQTDDDWKLDGLHHALVLQWSDKICNDVFTRLKRVRVHSTVNNKNIIRKESQIDLDICMDSFLNKETLSQQNAWYCPHCKDFKEATKKFDIWFAPEILIIHLKRFSIDKYERREKIVRYVNFPINGFDVGKFLKSPSEISALYDLYAISNHSGTLGGGHYTAYARSLTTGTHKWYMFDDSHVYPVSVNSIKTAAAYLLFYRRRH